MRRFLTMAQSIPEDLIVKPNSGCFIPAYADSTKTICVNMWMDLFFHLNEPDDDSVTDQARHVVYVESLHELGPMCFYGLGADFELLRNLLGGQTFGDQTQHFALSRAQRGEQLSFCRSLAVLEQGLP